MCRRNPSSSRGKWSRSSHNLAYTPTRSRALGAHSRPSRTSRKIQGFTSAPRPTIVACAPESSARFLCSYHVRMSPLPITGIRLSRAMSRMASQFAARVYRCSFVRAWMTTAAAPAFSTASASAVAGASDDPAPRRILTVSGIGTPSAMPRTRRSSLAGFLSSAAPKPRFHVSWIGHPQLRSRKSAPWSAASRPAFTPSAI